MQSDEKKQGSVQAIKPNRSIFAHPAMSALIAGILLLRPDPRHVA